MSFQQAPHKLLVIPGPIEFDSSVLLANATPGTSHVSPAFIPVFGDCLRLLKKVLYGEKPGNQPFLIAGSGTLGWDATAANLVEPGEDVLVLNHGYFGDSFADCLETYGAKVTQLKAPIGGVVSESDLVSALKSKKFKLVTITHVDTSTGVLAPAGRYAELVKQNSPDTLIALDAVCSVASEEIRFDDWGIDVVISATQKGLGVPPGLSVVLASERAIKTLEARKAPVGSYYISWKRWLPIMRAYEEGRPAYFATPPVQLVYALQVGLKEIVEGKQSLEDRFAAHKAASNKIKDGLAQLGVGFVPLGRDISANGMTAAKYPEGVAAADVLPKLAELDIVVAGGLHKDIASTYFRIGHMGVTAVKTERGDLDKVLAGVKTVLDAARAKK
ncbi:hypothetical protein Q8F55_002339 [Vanrija albida]|uniref:alanine--glyoxylate transaminase n=1 Tax=Vanrija albida TaxID=181172 RepID=A0ABR3Q9H3_9TREE